eukprot:m.495957 g.495957  ORF g.495957 m.495957 type:complete len:84 (+) comp21804_c0_seq7:977-1228(+)
MCVVVRTCVNGNGGVGRSERKHVRHRSRVGFVPSGVVVVGGHTTNLFAPPRPTHSHNTDIPAVLKQNGDSKYTEDTAVLTPQV